MKVLIHNDMELWDFMNRGLSSREDFIDIPLNRYCNKLQLACRKYLYAYNLPAWMVIGGKLQRILKKLDSSDEVILSAYTQPCLFRAVQKTVRHGVKVCLWMWNPVKDNQTFISNIRLLQKIGISCFTFDKEDSQMLGMQLLDTFYNMYTGNDHELTSNDRVYDFYFLGATKDRMSTVNEIKVALKGYANLFVTPSVPSEYITYAQNINNIINSRCIIDVVQNMQHDITLRPLEAIAYKRKLLTNNIYIKDYPFYTPENVFVWGVDDPYKLEEFLSTPFAEVHPDMVRKYDINTWFDRI